MELIISDEDKMQELGKKIAQVLTDKDLVYLIGELGAGKTTLVRGIARGKGYEGLVTSPTFTLMNMYQGDIRINHFDFYRLTSEDIYDLGLEDYLERNGLSLIEWPEAGQSYLPQDALLINIQLIDDDYNRERKVVISASGSYYLKKIEELQKLC